MSLEFKEWAKNPRKITEADFKTLQATLEKYGDISGIVLNKRTGELVGGHQRTRVFKDKESTVTIEKTYPKPTQTGTVALGYVEVDGERFSYREVDWDEAKAEGANIAANKVGGEFDWDKLANEFEMKTLFENGFKESELGFMREDVDPKDDAVPDVPELPTSKRGQVYQLGRHRIMCGDCITDTTKLMDGAEVDLILTDPPYNVDYKGKTKKELQMENDVMTDNLFRIFLRNAFGTAFAVLKPGGSYYIWHADLEGYNFRGALHDIGVEVRQCLVWNKNSMVLGRQDYHWKHEPCLYGWKEGAAHTWNSDRTQTTILDFERPTSSKEHPTMKPVELMAYQIRNNTLEGESVFDPFLGSGSTLIACEKTGRACYGMEIDPRYVDVVIKRWEEFTGEKAVLV